MRPRPGDARSERSRALHRTGALSGGTESPRWLGTVLDRLAAVMPQARGQAIEGAGYIPHVTHPERYVAGLTRFIGAV
ncbi:hypothetical protein GCM10011579_064110 [Streptomyces albiflavescens]|uniref:Alpha/beta hydrolase n=1 Tax=Streptomyces albiflavescens TaxID=1623582 RepID=A0A917Y919_9ACTN|nr:hypothetical protein GCM10011579_064110 [Streptomyces albiflavescens]